MIVRVLTELDVMHLRISFSFFALLAFATASHAALARMPNLVGLSIAEAKSYIDQHVLSVYWTGTGDTIAEQKPKAGAKIPGDRILQLTLKQGGNHDHTFPPYDVSKTEPVPSVTGLPLPAARAKLRAAGFQPDPQPPTKVAPDPKSINAVIEQDPPAGAHVPVPAAVRLAVYKPKIFRCPALAGQTIEQAYTALKPLPVKIEYRVVSTHGVIYSPEEMQRLDQKALSHLPVAAQNPESGGDTRPGQTVFLTVRYDPQTTVPALVNRPVREAVLALSAAGLRSHVRGDPEGIVASLEPDAGTSIARRSLVYIESDRDPPPHVPGMLH